MNAQELLKSKLPVYITKMEQEIKQMQVVVDHADEGQEKEVAVRCIQSFTAIKKTLEDHWYTVLIMHDDSKSVH